MMHHQIFQLEKYLFITKFIGKISNTLNGKINIFHVF